MTYTKLIDARSGLKVQLLFFLNNSFRHFILLLYYEQSRKQID